jgi:hypothetical protein
VVIKFDCLILENILAIFRNSTEIRLVSKVNLFSFIEAKEGENHYHHKRAAHTHE